jgi:hypothetical protein
MFCSRANPNSDFELFRLFEGSKVANPENPLPAFARRLHEEVLVWAERQVNRTARPVEHVDDDVGLERLRPEVLPGFSGKTERGCVLFAVKVFQAFGDGDDFAADDDWAYYFSEGTIEGMIGPVRSDQFGSAAVHGERTIHFQLLDKLLGEKRPSERKKNHLKL